MQLSDLVKPLDQMTHEELLAKVRSIREDSQVSRFATTKREATENKRRVSLKKKLDSLPEDEREALIAALKEMED